MAIAAIKKLFSGAKPIAALFLLLLTSLAQTGVVPQAPVITVPVS